MWSWNTLTQISWTWTHLIWTSQCVAIHKLGHIFRYIYSWSLFFIIYMLLQFKIFSNWHFIVKSIMELYRLYSIIKMKSNRKKSDVYMLKNMTMFINMLTLFVCLLSNTFELPSLFCNKDDNSNVNIGLICLCRKI